MSVKNGVQYCDYCKKAKVIVGFWIGAARDTDPGWILHKGTGKLSCDDDNCRQKGNAEAKAVIDRFRQEAKAVIDRFRQATKQRSISNER